MDKLTFTAAELRRALAGDYPELMQRFHAELDAHLQTVEDEAHRFVVEIVRTVEGAPPQADAPAAEVAKE